MATGSRGAVGPAALPAGVTGLGHGTGNLRARIRADAKRGPGRAAGRAPGRAAVAPWAGAAGNPAHGRRPRPAGAGQFGSRSFIQAGTDAIPSPSPSSEMALQSAALRKLVPEFAPPLAPQPPFVWMPKATLPDP